MNRLVLKGSNPLSLGHQHGETLREQIKELAEIRLERMCALSSYKTINSVLELALEHLPILQKFDPDLFLEFSGIAQASNVSLAKLVVLNNYTDMRDIKSPNVKDDSSECSIIFSPGQNAPILGQTWDIHASAMPYVVLLKFDQAVLFSIAGCLGMTGLTSYGLAISINNLASIDAKVGIIWPALVRKVLSHKQAALAKEEIMKAPLGSGHHYALADEKNFFSIETSGTKKKVVYENIKENYFHTNHCLDQEMRQTHIIPKESTSLWRYEQLQKTIDKNKPLNAAEVFLALKEVSMEPDPHFPHKTATCGTLVMDIAQRKVLACAGSPTEEKLKWPQTTLQI